MNQLKPKPYNVPRNFDFEGTPLPLKRKMIGIIETLNQPVISMKKLRAFLSDGIPDEAPIIRQYAWKIVLGYLPLNKSKWPSQIQKQDQIYQDFVDQYIPKSKYEGYPLIMTKKDPKWNEYQKDFYLWEQIEKDTCRTQAQLSFFSTQAEQIIIPFFTQTRKQKCKLINGDDEKTIKEIMANKSIQRQTYKYDIMTRILFIFAKLNPKVQYVQGMNQILAPIFWLVNNLKKPTDKLDQASCFFMFNNAMTDIIELHIKEFDRKQSGVFSKMRQMSKIILAVEPKIWNRLQTLKIDPFFYCFRWITLLFSQQFQLFQTLRIWQSIFSYEDRAVYVNFFALSLVVSCKKNILQGDYGYVMSYLKNISSHVNISDIIFQANELYQEYRFVDIIVLAEKNKRKLEGKQEVKSKKTRIVNFFSKYF